LADEKKEAYKAVYQGSGTFVISKPKRKNAKAHQSRLKNPRRGSRKS
jgi:preprotein translocase subunit YajC